MKILVFLADSTTHIYILFAEIPTWVMPGSSSYQLVGTNRFIQYTVELM